MAFLKNTNIDDTGFIKLSSGTDEQRPVSPLIGQTRWNLSSNYLEIWEGNEWAGIGKRALGSQTNPAPSGLALRQARPDLSSGFYWIQSPLMPNAIEMYVNMTREGGGYDFLQIDNGTSISFHNAAHTGTALGLDIVYPRSEQHWIAMREYVNGELGFSGSNFQRYFQTTGKIFRTANSVGGTGTGNYSSFVMRHPSFYGTGAPDWRVSDGGRWWLRNGTFGEPNGNYTLGSFLYFTSGFFPDNYNGGNISFDDASTRATGNFYLVSTNAKG